MTTLVNIKSLSRAIGKGFLFGLILIISSCVNERTFETPFEVVLGKKVFNDTRLSYNNTKSCASCHNQALAFTDGYRTSITANGEHLTKNSPTLLYLRYNNFFDYSNPKIRSLEQQHLRPLFGDHPVELGTDSSAFLSYVNSDEDYRKLLYTYDQERVSSFQEIINSIASYVMTLSHCTSPYDRYVAGDSFAMTENQIAGMKLFNTGFNKCSRCHTPPNFTNPNLTLDTSKIYPTSHWANNNLEQPVKVPTLRNVAVTGPYLHDGSINTLAEVLDKYNYERLQHSGIMDLTFTEEQKLQIIDFLYALTDDEYRDE